MIILLYHLSETGILQQEIICMDRELQDCSYDSKHQNASNYMASLYTVKECMDITEPPTSTLTPAPFLPPHK